MVPLENKLGKTLVDQQLQHVVDRRRNQEVFPRVCHLARGRGSMALACNLATLGTDSRGGGGGGGYL